MTLLDRLEAAQDSIALIKAEFSNSLVWKAICDHISKAKVNECKLCVKRHTLGYVRGHGPFTLRNLYSRPTGAFPNHQSTLRVDFDVRFHGYEDDDDTPYTKSIMLDIPETLINDYSVDKFESFLNDNWNFVKKTYVHELELVKKKYDSLKAVVEGL